MTRSGRSFDIIKLCPQPRTTERGLLLFNGQPTLQLCKSSRRRADGCRDYRETMLSIGVGSRHFNTESLGLRTRRGNVVVYEAVKTAELQGHASMGLPRPSADNHQAQNRAEAHNTARRSSKKTQRRGSTACQYQHVAVAEQTPGDENHETQKNTRKQPARSGFIPLNPRTLTQPAVQAA